MVVAVVVSMRRNVMRVLNACLSGSSPRSRVIERWYATTSRCLRILHDTKRRERREIERSDKQLCWWRNSASRWICVRRNREFIGTLT